MSAPVWTQYIAPATILEQVLNTAPFLRPRLRKQAGPLIEMGGAEDGFLAVLGSARTQAVDSLEDYFALCCAAHQATVATFVPTDVDSKIRGLLWNATRSEAELERMATFAMQMKNWTLDGISTRATTDPSLGPVSGHNGEWFSVASGGLGRCLQQGLDGEVFTEAITAELRREARAFQNACLKPGREIDVLLLAVSITHNLGDLDQGIGYWEGAAKTAAQKQDFYHLAHENGTPFGGLFQLISGLYKACLSMEGHRHYPLRPVRCLRQSPTLLLPLGPFLDDWGATIGSSNLLSDEDRADVLDALLKGCKKIDGQWGYFRALAGWQAAEGRSFQQAAEYLPAGSKKLLREPDLRQKIAVPRRSFESAYVKKVEALRLQVRAVALTE